MAKIYRLFRIVMPLIDFFCFLTRASDTTLDLQLPCVHSSDFLVYAKTLYQLGTRRWWLRGFPFYDAQKRGRGRRRDHKPFLFLEKIETTFIKRVEGRVSTMWQYCEDEERGSNWLYNSDDSGKYCLKKDWKIRVKSEFTFDFWVKNEVVQQYMDVVLHDNWAEK